VNKGDVTRARLLKDTEAYVRAYNQALRVIGGTRGGKPQTKQQKDFVEGLNPVDLGLNARLLVVLKQFAQGYDRLRLAVAHNSTKAQDNALSALARTERRFRRTVKALGAAKLTLPAITKPATHIKTPPPPPPPPAAVSHPAPGPAAVPQPQAAAPPPQAAQPPPPPPPVAVGGSG
jgi:hypothetical protein